MPQSDRHRSEGGDAAGAGIGGGGQAAIGGTPDGGGAAEGGRQAGAVHRAEAMAEGLQPLDHGRVDAVVDLDLAALGVKSRGVN